jgi:hypothetical protein
MHLQTIDTVHKAKTTFIESFVKDKDLSKSLTDLVDAEAQFSKSFVKALTEVQLSVNDLLYKPATWLKS